MLTKATFVVLIPSYGGYLWFSLAIPTRTRLRYFACFAWPLALWGVIIAALNWYRFGSVLDFGYGVEADQFTTPLLTGLHGLLTSPNKGAIFYAPLILMVPWSLWRMARGYRNECIFLVSVLAVQITVAAKWWSWEGGASWGPRLLFPILPLVAVAAGLLLELSKRALPAFIACLIAGVTTNILGVLVFFSAWGQIVDLHGSKIPLEVQGRPAREFVERDGKRFFSPDIAIFYLPILSPIYGHARLLGLRYFDKPFSLDGLCHGTPGNLPTIDFPPIEVNLGHLKDAMTISQICSAHLWLWDTVTAQPRAGDSQYPLYGIALELQGDRAMAEGKFHRAEDCYKRTADLMPGFARATLKLSTAQLKMAKRAEAQQTLDDYLQRYPEEVSVLLAAAQLSELSGDRNAALGKYQALLGRQPEDRIRRFAQERVFLLQQPDR